MNDEHKSRKKAVTGILMGALTAGAFVVQAAPDREREVYLGVLNGQVQGNSVVKVTRTLPSPVLFSADSAAGEALPGQLVIRQASGRAADGGNAWVTVSQILPESGERARITLNMTLLSDGKKVPVSLSQRGEDVVVSVPGAADSVELRSDSPAELEVPANYRGSLRVVLDVEGEPPLS